MGSQLSSFRYVAAALLGLVAATLAQQAGALMFATEDAIADFTFEDEDVVYTTPSLGEARLVLTDGNAVRLTLRDADGTETAFDPESGFSASLNLGVELSDSGVSKGDFMIFGSIPRPDDSGVVELMSGTLDAMQVDSDDESLAFLFAGKAITGSLAVQFQSVGIYAHVAGIDAVDWVGQYGQGSIMNLALNDIDAATSPALDASPAAPVPATAGLLLAGLLGLRLTRRRLRA
jgi:hypothetical protein